MSTSDREKLWAPLLGRLTAQCAEWLVYKGAESAFRGLGDIDSAAPPSRWDEIHDVVRDWSRENDLGRVWRCQHIPGGMNLVIAPPGASHVLEVGVKDYKTFRGSALFTWESLQPFAVVDGRGFRTVRTGVEGFIKLILNGLDRSGRPTEALCAKGIRLEIRSDPEGAGAATTLLPRVSRPAGRRLVEAVCAGDWDRQAAAIIEGAALLNGLRNPKVALSRLSFRGGKGSSCPVVHVLLIDKRMIPSDRESWLLGVEGLH